MKMIEERLWKTFEEQPEEYFDPGEIIDEIRSWLLIEHKIARLEKEKIEANELYYKSRSLYTHIGYTDLGIYSLSSRVDEVATEAADISMTYDKRIERLRKQLTLFEKIFSEEERQYLLKRFFSDNFKVNISDKSIYDKLNSIKEVCVNERKWMLYKKNGSLV